jgi:glycyl-tRNA synthetase beta subunit
MTKRVTNIFKDDPRDREVVKTETESEFTRRTYMIRRKYIDMIDRKAFWDREDKQAVLDEILDQYFKDKNIKPIPGKV